MTPVIGDTPEQLGSCMTADAMMIDGKIITKQQVAELMAQAEMHRNAEITWEKTMMQAVGEDGPKSVVEAIEAIKAERDNAWRELRKIRESIGANPEESTADEVRRVVAERVALAVQVEALSSAAQQLSFEIACDPSEPHFKSFAKLQDVLAATPVACLAQVRAEAGRAGFIAGGLAWGAMGHAHIAESLADDYVERIRQGGAQ